MIRQAQHSHLFSFVKINVVLVIGHFLTSW